MDHSLWDTAEQEKIDALYQSLRDVAEQGNIDDLYALIRRNAKVLDSMDEIPFVDTPLHIASSLGHTQFAMEIIKLKPSFTGKLNQNGFTPVHLALQRNQTQLVDRLLDVDSNLVRVRGREGVTPLHYAVQTGNLPLLTKFLQVCPKSLEDVTIRGETALHIALNNNQLDAFELLFQHTTFLDAFSLLEKKLLNWKDDEGNTVLHIAALKTLPQVVKWLLNARVDTNAMNLAGLTALDIIHNNEIRNMLCSASSLHKKMDNAANLWDVPQQEDILIDAMYALIRRDVKVLDRIDEIPFVETPLHTAASAGHIVFAMEIMRLKPSFARKLNEDGFTPMHLALKNDQTQLVHRLLDVDNDLIRVQGRGGVTPLHYAAQTGNLKVLIKFLKVCPKSIEDVTIRRETVLHIAIKYNKFDAFRLLLGWLRRAWFRNVSEWEKKLLNWKDENGNTVLHIATSKNQIEIVRLLLNFSTVDINIKNSSDRKALDMLQGSNPQSYCSRHLRRLRLLLCPSVAISNAKYFISRVSIEEKLYIMFLRLTTKISNDMRNVLLVVAALLVTVSFQAAISPPGGVWKENNDGYVAGTSTMTLPLYLIISSLNAISFFVTVFTTFLLLPSGFGTRLFCLPLYTLSLYFIESLWFISPQQYFPPAENRIWKYFILSCVISPGLILCLVVIVTFRRHKLVTAFRPKVKVLDTTLTQL